MSNNLLVDRSRPLRHQVSILLLLAIAIPFERPSAHVGDLDPTFGNSGIVILPNLRADAPFDTADAVAIQPDGEIVLVGRWGAVSPGPTFAVARFNPNGTLDGSFGFAGLATLSSGYAGGDEAHAVAIAFAILLGLRRFGTQIHKDWQLRTPLERQFLVLPDPGGSSR